MTVKAYHKNHMFKITVFIVIFSVLLGSLPAIAAQGPSEPAHGIKVSAILCNVVGKSAVKLIGSAQSWSTGDAGTNGSVDVGYKIVRADNSTESNIIVNDGFNAGNGYKIDFKSDDIPSAADNPVVSAEAIGEVKADWADGNTTHPVVYEPAVFAGDCPDDSKITPTLEPLTATPTKTPTHTPTVTRTPTSTSTSTSTPTPTAVVWDESNVTVDVRCVFGYRIFYVKNVGKAMTGDVAWQLLLNNAVIATGTYKLDANQLVTQVYRPGQYDGNLTLIVNQRPGHSGESKPQASMQSSACATSPTGSEYTDEPSDITISRIEEESSATTGVFLIQCLPDMPSNSHILVEILVTFTDEAAKPEVRKGYYCNTKIYIDGSVSNAVIIGAVADSQNAFPTIEPTSTSTPVSQTYLPVVNR